MLTLLRIASLALAVTVLGSLMVRATDSSGCDGDDDQPDVTSPPQVLIPTQVAPPPEPTPAPRRLGSEVLVPEREFMPATKAGPVLFPRDLELSPPPPAPAQTPPQDTAAQQQSPH
jgi:hypothetical protein